MKVLFGPTGSGYLIYLSKNYKEQLGPVCTNMAQPLRPALPVITVMSLARHRLRSCDSGGLVEKTAAG